ncbi:MAG: hypothetical protein Ct9H300mP21_06110 [Pseudomonadota bacterium]|nr:MAG: hypothetical protein Ct9H300mP21_06110 [Pseudomonadota bacterium]
MFSGRGLSKMHETGSTGTFYSEIKERNSNTQTENSKDLPRGIIHGDLSPVNVIGRKGQVLALLDFEEICMESFVLDIAMTFVHFGWKDGLPVSELWDALLDGYQSVRHLTDAERAALPHLHRYSVLALAAWRYSEYVIKIPGQSSPKDILRWSIGWTNSYHSETALLICPGDYAPKDVPEQ